MASNLAVASADDVAQFSEALASWAAQPGKWFWSSVSAMLCSRCSTLTAQQASRILAAAQQVGGMSEEALLALQLRLEDCGGQQSTQRQQVEEHCSIDRYRLRRLGYQQVQQPGNTLQQHVGQQGAQACQPTPPA